MSVRNTPCDMRRINLNHQENVMNRLRTTIETIIQDLYIVCGWYQVENYRSIPFSLVNYQICKSRSFFQRVSAHMFWMKIVKLMVDFDKISLSFVRRKLRVLNPPPLTMSTLNVLHQKFVSVFCSLFHYERVRIL